MGQANPALSLPVVAQAEETAWRRGMDMIDALAYVDLMDDDDKARVEQLIQEEMAGSGKRASDYMSELPPLPPSRFAADSALSRALEGAASGESLSAMDTARYRLDPPLSGASSSAWRQALDNAHAQLEHQRVRITNLELLLQYGPSAWRMANDGLATTLSLTQASIREVEAETLELNRRRKLEQLSAAQDLERSYQEAEVLRLKCVDIERACRELERQQGGKGESGT